MMFFYVDYVNGSWLGTHQFSDEMLQAVCDYLYYEFLRVYYLVNLDLFVFSAKFKPQNGRMTAEDSRRLRENYYAKELDKLFKFYTTQEFIDTYRLAKAVFDSL